MYNICIYIYNNTYIGHIKSVFSNTVYIIIKIFIYSMLLGDPCDVAHTHTIYSISLLINFQNTIYNSFYAILLKLYREKRRVPRSYNMWMEECYIYNIIYYVYYIYKILL